MPQEQKVQDVEEVDEATKKRMKEKYRYGYTYPDETKSSDDDSMTGVIEDADVDEVDEPSSDED